MNKAYEFYKTKEGSECLDRFIFAEAYAKKCIREMPIHIEKGITDTYVHIENGCVIVEVNINS